MSDAEGTIEDLIVMLRAIETAADITSIKECHNHYLVHLAHCIASDVMIICGGIIDEVCVRQLHKEGFRVYPGETDVFGCLTACIETTKGVIVFD